MLGSHQTRNLSDVFPSQLRDRYVQLSPAVSCQAAELQLSGHSGAPAQPPPAARPSNPEVKAKAALSCQLSTIGSRSFAVIVGNFHTTSPPHHSIYPPSVSSINLNLSFRAAMDDETIRLGLGTQERGQSKALSVWFLVCSSRQWRLY